MILYKYLSLSRMSFWENYMLRFTQPSQFNDPFDSLSAHSFLPEKLMPNNSGFEDIASLFYGIEQDCGAFNDNHAVLCLSESFDNILMWSHYADNHQGFVIGFDVSHPFFEFNESTGTRKVQYCDIRPEGLAENVIDEIYYKYSIWSYEKEWRLSKPLHKRDDVKPDNVYLYRLPPESINCVYLGINMPYKKKEQIYEFAKSSGIECYQMLRKYQTYEIYPVPYIDFLSMKKRSDKFKEDLKKEELPSSNIPPSTTKELIAKNILSLTAILNEITSTLNINDTVSSDYDKVFLEEKKQDLININCMPKSFESCDSTVSKQIYWDRVQLIQSDFDNCLYHIKQLLEQIDLYASKKIPQRKKWHSNVLDEKLGAAISSFASCIAECSIFLDKNDFKTIIRQIKFDNELSSLTLGNQSYKECKRISLKWYKKKAEALNHINNDSLHDYQILRMEWICTNVGILNCGDYIEKYCPYNPSKPPERQYNDKGYVGPLSEKIRNDIQELAFFYDIVQSNGGFVKDNISTLEEEQRRKERIKHKLQDAGISEEYISTFMSSMIECN